MAAKLLAGEPLAGRILAGLEPRAAAFKAKARRSPLLAVLQSADPAAQSFRRAQEKACSRTGISARFVPWPSSAPEALKKLRALARDPEVDAIVADHPLPKGLEAPALWAELPAAKDAEGVGAESQGRLYLAKTWKDVETQGLIAPSTALAVAALALECGGVAGKRAVVIGRSNIVGRPAAHLLSCLDATVTLCHSRTRDVGDEVRRADIVVACLGRERFVQGDWIRPGAAVIDAGINRTPEGIQGDVDFEACARAAGFITPVPGGVGPVTTAMLLRNVLALAEARGG